MKRLSSFVLAALVSLVLSACAENSRNFPNLSTVPEKPKEFSTPEERESLKERLEQDRLEAEGLSVELTEPEGSIIVPEAEVLEEMSGEE